MGTRRDERQGLWHRVKVLTTFSDPAAGLENTSDEGIDTFINTPAWGSPVLTNFSKVQRAEGTTKGARNDPAKDCDEPWRVPLWTVSTDAVPAMKITEPDRIAKISPLSKNRDVTHRMDDNQIKLRRFRIRRDAGDACNGNGWSALLLLCIFPGDAEVWVHKKKKTKRPAKKRKLLLASSPHRLPTLT